jgi:hypothetical protein
MPASSGPFTPAAVLAELQKVVSEDTRLGVFTPAVVHLTHVLNIIHWKLRAGPRCDGQALVILQDESRKRSRHVGVPKNAIEQEQAEAWRDWAQSGVWPAVSQGWAVHDPGPMRWPKMDAAVLQEAQGKLEERCNRRRQIGDPLRLEAEKTVQQLKKEIADLKHETARRKRVVTSISEREHALRLARRILDMREVRGWRDFAEPLQVIFCAELSGHQSKNMAYSFIAAVTPAITGKDVRPGALKRFVNRHAHASGDKL